MPPSKWNIGEFAEYAEERRQALGLSIERLADRIAHHLNPGLTPDAPGWQSYTAKQVQRVLHNKEVAGGHFTGPRIAAWVKALEMDEVKAFHTLRSIPSDMTEEGLRLGVLTSRTRPPGGGLAVAS